MLDDLRAGMYLAALVVLIVVAERINTARVSLQSARDLGLDVRGAPGPLGWVAVTAAAAVVAWRVRQRATAEADAHRLAQLPSESAVPAPALREQRSCYGGGGTERHSFFLRALARRARPPSSASTAPLRVTGSTPRGAPSRPVKGSWRTGGRTYDVSRSFGVRAG